MHDYPKTELGITVFHEPQVFNINNSSIFIGHGDGKGPNDMGYKRMKKVFTSPFFQWLFRWLHPDIGVRIAQYLSVKNKLISGEEDKAFLGEEKEWLAQYARRKLKDQHYDYFVFGHRHLPMTIDLNGQSTYINLGDWITHDTYGVFDQDTLRLERFTA